MKVLVKIAVVTREWYDYIISQGNSNNLGEFFFFGTAFILKSKYEKPIQKLF
jgi:hypothetical protein